MSKKNPKVIIVGNNPILLEKNYGEFIDSYDIVIRINRCTTKGLEKHTGTKTDIWATTYLHYDKSFNHEDHYDAFIPNNFDELLAIWYRTPITKSKLIRLPLKNQKTYIMSKNTQFKNNFPEYYKIQKNLKSEFDTGLLTILTSTLFYKDITIIGFDFFEKYNSFSKNVEGYYKNFIDKNILEIENKMWESGKGLVNITLESKNKIIKELISAGKIKAVDYV
tara:strand:- start:1105 stop:1770 length:666 start_codon:yes stop_codon:yes gene_type:complete